MEGPIWRVGWACRKDQLQLPWANTPSGETSDTLTHALLSGPVFVSCTLAFLMLGEEREAGMEVEAGG